MFMAPFRQRLIHCVALLAACAVLTSLIGPLRLSAVQAAEPEVTRVLEAAGAAPRDVNSAIEAPQADSAEGNGADYFDLKPRTASELAIDRALQRTAEVDFQQMPLAEVATYLQEAHHIPVVLDRSALEEAGMTGDEPVTAKLQNISLRSVLNLLLRDLKLTYLIKDEVLVVTTPDRADSFLEARVYAFPQQSAAQMDALVKLIREMDPESWSDSGGPGYIGVYGHGLLVRQTQKVHEQIHQVLHQLQYLKQDPPAP